MGTLTFTDGYISVDSNDISGDSNQINMTYEAEALDDTVFGDDTRSNKGGLKNWSFEVQGFSDFDDSAADDILFPLVGTVVAIEVRPTSDSVGSNNPKYTGNGLIQSYSPIQNSVGELAGFSLNISAAGTLARSES